jgi:hypothetical protein
MPSLDPSIQQKKLVESLIDHRNSKSPIRKVAEDLHVTPGSVNQKLYRLREAYNKHLAWVDWYRKNKKLLAKPGRYL